MSKRYWEIGSLEYQKEVLQKLENRWKISAKEKIALIWALYVWQVSKILAIDIDFTTKKQDWVINIARKVKEQDWTILNVAKNVDKQKVFVWANISNQIKKQIEPYEWELIHDNIWVEQNAGFWINIANGANKQVTNLWINIANNVDREQITYAWINISKEVGQQTAVFLWANVWWQVFDQDVWLWLNVAWKATYQHRLWLNIALNNPQTT